MFEHAGDLVCDVRGQKYPCSYISSNCDDYFDLAKTYYCSAHVDSWWFTGLYCLAIVLCLVLLFACISLMVASLFFPNVNYFTKTCGWDGRILSVMLLPLTNSLPDMVSYYITLQSNSINLVLGQLIGSIMVMFTIIIGTISFFCDFTVADSRWVLRDFAWVVAVMVIFLYILSDGRITTTECVIMLLLFAVYLFYLSRYDQLPLTQQKDREYTRQLAHLETTLPLLLPPVLLPRSLHSYESTASDGPVIDEVVEILEHKNTHHQLMSLFHHAIEAVERFLAFIIPVVEEEGSTSTPVLRCWSSTIVSVLVNFEFGLVDWPDIVPVVLLVVLITEAVYHYFKHYKVVVSLVGVFSFMIVVSLISQVILLLLKNLGVLLKISDYMLGLMVFAISNSITDIITNITISVTVDPIYGVNCLLGSPIILILLGIGANGLLLLAAGHNLKFKIHNNFIISAAGVLLLMMFYILYIPLNKWRFDRKIGVIVWIWAIAIMAATTLLD